MKKPIPRAKTLDDLVAVVERQYGRRYSRQAIGHIKQRALAKIRPVFLKWLEGRVKNHA